METIKPNPSQFLLPPGTREVAYAEYQKEYNTLPSLVTPDGRVVSQWKPTPNDLILLNSGVAVSLVIHTFGLPLQPIQMAVGGIDLR